MPAARMPGLPAHPIIMIYDDVRQIGSVRRGGREVKVSITLQGWWCEARAFGEAEYATNYETQVPVPTLILTGMTEEEVRSKMAEQMRLQQEEIQTFGRECHGVFGEMAHGRRFFPCDRSGHFIKDLQAFGAEAAENLRVKIASYNLAQGETPDALIASLGTTDDRTYPAAPEESVP